MPEWCVQHPGDASRWVPVSELLAELWSKWQAAAAVVEQQAQSIIDHDVLFKVQSERLTGLHAAVDGMTARLDALAGHVTQSDERAAELGVWLSELEDRIEALEPEPSGPAFGVDISGHQTAAVTKAVVDDPANTFVIVKATEGMGGRNDDYAAQRATAGGKFLGAYHFAWTGQDPLKEADNFLATAALKPGDLAFLDAEKYNDTDPIDWAKSVTFCLTWLDTVKARTGATPLVYVNWNWIKGLRTAATVAQWERLVTYPLWIAQWTNTAGQYDTVSPKTGSSKGWPVALHQYGVIDNLDRNWTPDRAALRALAVK